MFKGNSVFLADAVSIPAQRVLLDLLPLVQDFLDIILSKMSAPFKPNDAQIAFSVHTATSTACPIAWQDDQKV